MIHEVPYSIAQYYKSSQAEMLLFTSVRNRYLP
jgi:hypothetical protein